MAVKIRLQRKGRKKAPFYHIVIADARAPRDGRFIEKIGIYNPITKPATVEIDRDKAFEWLMKGAQPTDTIRAIMRYKGVLYRKHLSRGVAKGALTQEVADQMYQDWIVAKEGSISQKVEARKLEVADIHKKMSGEVENLENRVVAETPNDQETTNSQDSTESQEASEAPHTEESTETLDSQETLESTETPPDSSEEK